MLPQKVAQERRGRGLASQGRWARALMQPNCVSLVFPLLLPWVMVLSFLLKPPAPPPTWLPVSMTKWKESEEKPPRCPPSCSHVLCPPARPHGAPSLPILKPPGSPVVAGPQQCSFSTCQHTYLVISNSEIQLDSTHLTLSAAQPGPGSIASCPDGSHLDLSALAPSEPVLNTIANRVI